VFAEQQSKTVDDRRDVDALHSRIMSGVFLEDVTVVDLGDKLRHPTQLIALRQSPLLKRDELSIDVSVGQRAEVLGQGFVMIETEVLASLSERLFAVASILIQGVDQVAGATVRPTSETSQGTLFAVEGGAGGDTFCQFQQVAMIQVT
jgi:hypothetical protein